MSSEPGALPEVSPPEHDVSPRARRFSKVTSSYFAPGSVLNRYSYLRSDAAFLQEAVSHPTARFVALYDSNVVVVNTRQLAVFSWDSMSLLLGERPFGVTDKERISRYDSTAERDILIVYLGSLGGLESGTQIETSNHGKAFGDPWFAVDITSRRARPWAEAVLTNGFGLLADPLKVKLRAEHAAIFGHARYIMDWNLRNLFCSACGHANISISAGYKRLCPPTDLEGGQEPVALTNCPLRRRVANIPYSPRTDPVSVAAVVSADGERVLLGRQKNLPPHCSSILAGFMEPGESLEEAVRRQVREKTGVRVGRVIMHSTQPWPYPSCLVIGSIAQALPGQGEVIDLNDKELETAKWFTLDEVRNALDKKAGALGTVRPEYHTLGNLQVPIPSAIATSLIMAVVGGYLAGRSKVEGTDANIEGTDVNIKGTGINIEGTNVNIEGINGE